MNLIFKLLGLGRLWDVLDGYKTAIAALAAFLHAAAAFALFAAGGLEALGPVLQAHDLSGLLHLAQQLLAVGQDPHVAAFGSAWRDFYSALGLVGIGHKLEKAAAPAQISQEQTTPEDPAL